MRNELARLAGKLLAAVATCERLVQTPIPQSYVRHTSRFLSLWCANSRPRGSEPCSKLDPPAVSYALCDGPQELVRTGRVNCKRMLQVLEVTDLATWLVPLDWVVDTLGDHGRFMGTVWYLPRCHTPHDLASALEPKK
eukprot:3223598-Amphidinium_carterae.1